MTLFGPVSRFELINHSWDTTESKAILAGLKVFKTSSHDIWLFRGITLQPSPFVNSACLDPSLTGWESILFQSLLRFNEARCQITILLILLIWRYSRWKSARPAIQPVEKQSVFVLWRQRSGLVSSQTTKCDFETFLHGNTTQSSVVPYSEIRLVTRLLSYTSRSSISKYEMSIYAL